MYINSISEVYQNYIRGVCVSLIVERRAAWTFFVIITGSPVPRCAPRHRAGSRRASTARCGARGRETGGGGGKGGTKGGRRKKKKKRGRDEKEGRENEERKGREGKERW